MPIRCLDCSNFSRILIDLYLFTNSFLELVWVSFPCIQTWTSLVAQPVKWLPTTRKTRFNPWVRKISWRRKWQLTLVFLPGKSHGWSSLVGYSPWGGRVRHYWLTSYSLSNMTWKLYRYFHCCYLELISSTDETCCLTIYIIIVD